MKLLAYIFMAILTVASALGADTDAGGADSPNPPAGAPATTHGTPAVTPSGTLLPQSASQWIYAAIVAGVVGGLLFFVLHRSRKSNARDAKDITTAQLAVIAVAVAIASGFGGAMLSKYDLIIDLLVALVAGVFTIQIGEILRSHHLSKRMQSLERALDSEMTYSRLDDQLNDLANLTVLLQKHQGARPLFDEFLADAYNALNDSLESFAAGTINVEDTARELTFNKDCLQHLV